MPIRTDLDRDLLDVFLYGTVDGNRTRRDLIDSQVSPPGGLYGIKLAPRQGIEPCSFLINSQAHTPCLLTRNKIWCLHLDSNQGLPPYQDDTLPTEL